MIQSLNINDWVNQGRDHLQDNNICPFCQEKTITDKFREDLESYFDTSFTQAIERIKRYREEYDLLVDNICNQLAQIEATERTKVDTKIDINKFSSYLKTFVSQCSNNKQSIYSKDNEPSRSIDLISTKEQALLIEEIIQSANDKVASHNQLVNNYKSEKSTLISEIWKYILEEAKGDIDIYKNKILSLEKGISGLDKVIEGKIKLFNNLKNEINDLSKNITSIEPTIIEINMALKKFGFLNFEIVPSKSQPNHYHLQRENGDLAESTLSEGEITFITFLYFMQLSKGSNSRCYSLNIE